MLVALGIFAYLILGYFTVFLVEYTEPNSHWDTGVPWIMALMWPIVSIFLLFHFAGKLADKVSFISPIALARKVKQSNERRKRVIIKGKRGFEDG